MNKALIIGLVIVVVLLGAGFFFLSPKAPTAALLYVHTGLVEVHMGDDWTPATNEMVLKEGAQVRTKEGKATIVLFEGEVSSLGPNSHVVLSKLSSSKMNIAQLAGEVYNKVTRISGVSEFSVATPTTVATVRGTEFISRLIELLVHEGEVSYTKIDSPERALLVKYGYLANGETLTEEQLTTEDNALFDAYRESLIETLKRVRWREIQKHQDVLGLASMQGVTQETIKQWLNEIDSGKRDLDELYNKIPGLFKGRAHRAYMLSKAILNAQKRS